MTDIIILRGLVGVILLSGLVGAANGWREQPGDLFMVSIGFLGGMLWSAVGIEVIGMAAFVLGVRP